MTPDARFEIDKIEFPHDTNAIMVTIQYVHPPELAGQAKEIPILFASPETHALELRMRDTIQSISDEILRQYRLGSPSEFLGYTDPEET